jgi:hypothetical protein
MYYFIPKFITPEFSLLPIVYSNILIFIKKVYYLKIHQFYIIKSIFKINKI